LIEYFFVYYYYYQINAFSYDRPDYVDSTWGRMLRDPTLSIPGSRSYKLFKRRFRLPVPLFKVLIQMCIDANICQKQPANAYGIPSIPFELKVLGVLRIVGRGWCLDDVYESAIREMSN
jgi:hypothetical protein